MTQKKLSTIAQVPGTYRYFINALNENSTTSIALGVVLAHKRTGEEAYIDLVIEDDRLWRVLMVIREHFNSFWCLQESFELEALAPIEEERGTGRLAA